MLQIMQSMVINMPFLYFPEDKSEYLPAGITMVVCFIIAILAFLFIKKVSKKQEEKTKALEEKINRERQNEHP